MNVKDVAWGGQPLSPAQSRLMTETVAPPELNAGAAANEAVRKKFQHFVAGTFYKQMLAAMRRTLSDKPLMNGGRAEEIFRNQLDQTVAEQFAVERGGAMSDKMYEQFALKLADAGPSLPRL